MRRYVASDLKDMNRQTVYNLLASVKEISRAEISRLTGISVPTVIKIINHFERLGFISFKGEGKSKLGRKPKMLRFNKNAAFSIGINVEGDQVTIGVVDLIGDIIRSESFKVVPDFVSLLENHLSAHIKRVIKHSHIPTEKIMGVGIGVPGSVSPDRGIINVAPLVGIKEQTDISPLIEELESKLNLPVRIEKDVNAAAIGEFVHRRNPSNQNLVYISLGTGVGAGLILNGRLHRGVNSLAGEIGYLTFDPTITIDSSAPGWLESRIGYHTFALDSDSFSIVHKILDDLSLAIAAISTILDVEHIVVGGIGAKQLGSILLDALNAKVSRLCLKPIQCVEPVCPDPVVVGTAWIITDTRLSQLLDGSI